MYFVTHVPLNSSGLPLCQGENECSYYMKTGHCKFEATCKFHHPELGFLSETPTMYPAVQPSPISSPHPYQHLTNWQMRRAPIFRRSFLPGSLHPSKGGVEARPLEPSEDVPCSHAIRLCEPLCVRSPVMHAKQMRPPSIPPCPARPPSLPLDACLRPLPYLEQRPT
ncbi:unnamed protein product [Urochloa humidicola]